MDGPKRTRRKSVPKKASCRGLPLSPAASKKLENAQYRSKLKEDARRNQMYKARQAENAMQWRKSLTEEQKSVQRENARLRQIAFRARQKKQPVSKSRAVTNGCLKPRTRTKDKKTQDKRERNRLSQQKRRANMSAQKKQQEREKNLARWHYRRNKVACQTSL